MSGHVIYGSSLSKKTFFEPVRHPWAAMPRFVDRTTSILGHAGVTAEDILAVFFRFGPYTLAHHLFFAVEKVGASVWPYGLPMSTPIDVLQRYCDIVRPTVIAGLPSTLFWLIRNAIRIPSCATVITAGEYLSPTGMQYIGTELRAAVFNHFGSTEIPSMTYTCRSMSGVFHVFEGISYVRRDGYHVLRDNTTGREHVAEGGEIDVLNDLCPHCSFAGVSLLARSRTRYVFSNGISIGLNELTDALNRAGVFEFYCDEAASRINVVKPSGLGEDECAAIDGLGIPEVCYVTELRYRGSGKAAI